MGDEIPPVVDDSNSTHNVYRLLKPIPDGLDLGFSPETGTYEYLYPEGNKAGKSVTVVVYDPSRNRFSSLRNIGKKLKELGYVEDFSLPSPPE